MADEDVDRWLEILVSKEILFSRPVGATRQHVFRHALLHQAAYAMLSPKEVVNGHYLAGDFLEEQSERDAIVLADHFEKGEKVRIIDGPFANFEGDVEEIHEERSTIKVMVTVFGRSTPVELDFIQVEKR